MGALLAIIVLFGLACLVVLAVTTLFEHVSFAFGRWNHKPCEPGLAEIGASTNALSVAEPKERKRKKKYRHACHDGLYTSLHEGRLWCSWCENWAKAESDQPRAARNPTSAYCGSDSTSETAYESENAERYRCDQMEEERRRQERRDEHQKLCDEMWNRQKDMENARRAHDPGSWGSP